MQVDWHAAAEIGKTIVALFAGAWVNRWFESRPKLISYFGHVSTFRATPPGGGNPALVNTHSVVLKNAGRRSATNVRLRHIVLPDFNVWPGLQHHVEDLPGGEREIVIPRIVAGEEVTISYLYLPPLTVAQINAGIKSDEGFAHSVPVLLQRQYPQWFNLSAFVLMLLGLMTALYLLFVAGARVWRMVG